MLKKRLFNVNFNKTFELFNIYLIFSISLKSNNKCFCKIILMLNLQVIIIYLTISF